MTNAPIKRAVGETIVRKIVVMSEVYFREKKNRRLMQDRTEERSTNMEGECDKDSNVSEWERGTL